MLLDRKVFKAIGKGKSTKALYRLKKKKEIKLLVIRWRGKTKMRFDAHDAILHVFIIGRRTESRCASGAVIRLCDRGTD